jgi:hypothetical protein
MKMFVLAVTVEKSYGRPKREALDALDCENAVLRHLIRMAATRTTAPQTRPRLLSFRKYEYWAKLLDEIGRIICGYLKSQR